jgi:CheY-like chemotaxis protein
MFTAFVIDDDPEAARATSKLLRANGYDVQIEPPPN